MNLPRVTLRKRTIVLPDQGAATHEPLLAELRNIEAVANLRMEGNLLEIVYHFPTTGFDMLWPLISRHIDGKCLGLPTRLSYEWIRLCEANEREHLLCRYGWDAYVQDIHVANHLRESERRSKQPRKPWQQVKRPAKNRDNDVHPTGGN